MDPGQPVDCADIQVRGSNVSGVYAIYPGKHTNAYCDMVTDGGGWTVFQRRSDGSENFNRNWSDYKIGFGSISSEHWLGNDMIHQLSNQRNYELRVDLEDFEGITGYANYGLFRIEDETLDYKLTIRSHSGNASDSLSYHNGMKFSTYDRDYLKCADYFRSGWWFRSCLLSNLNGVYFHDEANGRNGIKWKMWKPYSLKMSEMKIRPVL
nr:fibrinogen C domain-containing protein 1-like [Lytechinus pictus]